jgi:DNA recombination protein RmuC
MVISLGIFKLKLTQHGHTMSNHMFLIYFFGLSALMLGINYIFCRTFTSKQQDHRAINDHLIELKTLHSVTQKSMLDMQHNIQLLFKEQHKELHLQRTSFDAYQQKSMQMLQQTFIQSMAEIRQQVVTTLEKHTQSVNQKIDTLTQQTSQKLQDISQQVEKKLQQGFEKTTQTFHDVIKRLALIDQAQQKITELSSNVISLQAILADKKSRGTFGEVQLASMIKNLLPSNSYQLQHTLSNGKRVDCMLLLPEPTGKIAVDAKFPLEGYQKLMNADSQSSQYKSLARQFKNDIKKHINDIANKYIIQGETADGAVMFIPAEAIFAEIHANHADLVELAHQSRVWLTSPTTMMAVLTTARAVIKDFATREQVHLIQYHLIELSKDFKRFKVRMDQLTKHIQQAHQDVEQVQRSSHKISTRFGKIEQVEFEPLNRHTKEEDSITS